MVAINSSRSQHYKVQLCKKTFIVNLQVSAAFMLFFPNNTLIEMDLPFRNVQGHCVRVLKPRYPRVLRGL